MSKWVSFDQNIILLLYLEIQVRFIYPEHVMIMKCEDPEEVEEDDDEIKFVFTTRQATTETITSHNLKMNPWYVILVEKIITFNNIYKCF